MSNKNKNKIGVVYSTDPGFRYQTSTHVQKSTLPPAQQQLRIRLETKHRAGKAVTVISGFYGSEADLSKLASQIKQACGTGGSAKDELILIQGDCREKVLKFLIQKGYKAR